MKFINVITRNAKRLIPMLGIAGASLFLGGCEKDEPQRDVNLFFYSDKLVDTSLIEEIASQPDVRTIYLIPLGDHHTCYANNIRILTTNLKPRINASPKTRGQGDFNFFPGEASKVPEDSLWITQQGWTINATSEQLNQHVERTGQP